MLAHAGAAVRVLAATALVVTLLGHAAGAQNAGAQNTGDKEASQQAFPSRALRIVVPFASGTSDSVARIVGQSMAEILGQPVVIENKPGANGVVASEFVARQAPDGYTLQLCANATHGLASLFMKNVPFDPLRDFTMIGGIISAPFALLVHASVPARTVPELLQFVKNNPDRRGLGSGGVGSHPHLAVELLNQATGLGFQHVPYRGGGPALNDLVAGHIPMLFATIGTAKEFVDAGRIRMIAVMGEKRLPDFPDLPALGETIPGFDVPDFVAGLCGPAGMPAPVVTGLHTALDRALRTPRVAAQIEKLLMTPAPLTPQQFRSRLEQDYAIFRRITTAAGIRPE
jgi:tripartite-type tricarboxylate transporter receptor subunit TctC